MRYAIVSDIHANWQAWEAILADIESVGADSILCLGDIVGYGPEPSRVLESVSEHCDNIVLGNHDAVVAGQCDPDIFNDEARAVIDWTSAQLNDDDRSYLAELPMEMTDDAFICTHASVAAPEAFGYVIDEEAALTDFQSCTAPLIFIGHTHQATIFTKQTNSDQIYTYLPGVFSTPNKVATEFTLLEDTRYHVNVGAVGEPRDRDTRGGYVIYDDDAKSLSFRRIAFDYRAYAAALAATDIQKKPYFLQLIDYREQKEHDEAAEPEPTEVMAVKQTQPIAMTTPARTKKIKMIKKAPQAPSTRPAQSTPAAVKKRPAQVKKRSATPADRPAPTTDTVPKSKTAQPEKPKTGLIAGGIIGSIGLVIALSSVVSTCNREELARAPLAAAPAAPVDAKLKSSLQRTLLDVQKLIIAAKNYSERTGKPVTIRLSKFGGKAIGTVKDTPKEGLSTSPIPGTINPSFQEHITLENDVTISYTPREGFSNTYTIKMFARTDTAVTGTMTINRN
jgi:predicted phosphodiesterase